MPSPANIFPQSFFEYSPSLSFVSHFLFRCLTIELKYLSAKDNEETAIKQREEAVKQLQLFATDRNVGQMTRDTKLHLIVMQIRLCELVRMEEV